MTARELTAALGGVWRGGYGMAPCPAHDDQDPSLAIRAAGDRVLVHCHAGCPQPDVVAALKRLGVWHQPTERPASCESAADTGADRSELARRIWREAVDIADTPAERYVRARGITIPLPPTLRYARLKHGPTGLTMPALIAAVQGPDRRVVAIHRTFLTGGGERKATVSSPKMALGPLGTGAECLLDKIQILLQLAPPRPRGRAARCAHRID